MGMFPKVACNVLVHKNDAKARRGGVGMWSSQGVLHRVGADGVSVKFPIFAVNCGRLPLSSVRKKQRKQRKIKKKKTKKTKKKNKKQKTKSKEKRKKKKKKIEEFLRPHLHQPH